MALPTSLLIAVERLKQDENKVFRLYSGLHAPTVGIALIDSAVQTVALDRIAFAKDFVDSAKVMITGTPNATDLRNATSRAYYAVHHSLRAVLLFDLKADTYGHAESIERFLDRMSDKPPLNTKAAGAGITKTTLNDILHNRHLADYHYYGSSDPREVPVDFSVTAPQAVKFADDVVVKMEEYLQDRIAGAY